MRLIFILFAFLFLCIHVDAQEICCKEKDCIQIFAEESAGLNSGQREYSFGNGATRATAAQGGAILALKSGYIDVLGCSVEVSGTLDTQIAIVVNNSFFDTLTIEANSYNATKDVDIHFQKLDILDWVTITAGGASSAVPTMLVCYD